MIYSAGNVGKSTGLGWNAVVEKNDDGVHIIAAVAISGRDAATVGKLITERMAAAVLRKAEDCYQLIEDCALQAHALQARLYVAAAFEFKTFTCYSTFHGSVFLRRRAEAATLLETGQDVGFVRGGWQDGDVVVLSTLPGEGIVATAREHLAHGYSVHSLPKAIQVAIRSLPDASLVGLVFIADEPFPEQVAEYITLSDQLVPHGVQQQEPPEQVAELPHHQQESDPHLGEIESSEESSVVATPSNRIANLFSTAQNVGGTVSSVGGRLLPRMGSFFTIVLRGIAAFTHSSMRVAWPIAREGSGYLFEQARNTLRGKQRIHRMARSTTEETRRRKSGAIVLFFGLIAVVVVSALFARNIRQRTAQARVDERLAAAQVRLSELENQAVADPEMALQSTPALIGEIEQISADSVSVSNPEALRSVQQSAEQLRQSLQQQLATTQMPELVVYASSDPAIDAPSLVGGDSSYVVLYSSQSRSLTSVAVADGSQTSIVMPAAVEALTVADGKAYVVMNGIWMLDLSAPTLEPIQIRNKGNSNTGATAISVYGSSVYVFNPVAEQIFRYVAQDETTYGQPIEWLSSVDGIEFDRVASMTIDGDIWLGTQDGTILRFVSGGQETFAATGDVLVGALQLESDREADALYALSTDTGAVLRIDKQGSASVVKQDDVLKDALDMVVLGASNTAYVALSDRVVEVQL